MTGSRQTEMRYRFRLTEREARFVYFQVKYPFRSPAWNYTEAGFKTKGVTARDGARKLQDLHLVRAAERWLREALWADAEKRRSDGQ